MSTALRRWRMICWAGNGRSMGHRATIDGGSSLLLVGRNDVSAG
jgi:hypothetical protein